MTTSSRRANVRPSQSCIVCVQILGYIFKLFDAFTDTHFLPIRGLYDDVDRTRSAVLFLFRQKITVFLAMFQIRIDGTQKH